MKKYLLLIITVILFFSCKEEEEVTPISKGVELTMRIEVGESWYNGINYSYPSVFLDGNKVFEKCKYGDSFEYIYHTFYVKPVNDSVHIQKTVTFDTTRLYTEYRFNINIKNSENKQIFSLMIDENMGPSIYDSEGKMVGIIIDTLVAL